MAEYYGIVTLDNMADLVAYHPIPTNYNTGFLVVGVNYPISVGDVMFFVFDFDSTITPDNINVFRPTHSDFDTQGRFIREQLDTVPQVNSDWLATSGVTQILNKPSLSAVATSGSYADLTGKPTIPAAQVNSDWNSSSGLSQILNKPSLHAVATSGSYVDLINKPTIPLAYAAGAPSAISPTLGTAYQASTNTKNAVITVNLSSNSSISLGGAVNNEGGVWIGTTSAVASGTGTQVGRYQNNLGGTLVIGLALNLTQSQTITFVLPTGWYYAVRQTAGTGLTVSSAFEQLIN